MESACFPHGLRVLVVDADTNGSKKLENNLMKCNYQVTICNSASVALDMMGKSKDGFDIIISDSNASDMFLEQVGIDLPVVMMCVDGERNRVMKGIQHGACDYLLKPVKLNELRKIWQHVYRKRVHKERERGGGIGIGIGISTNGIEEKENLDQHKFDDSYSFSVDMVTGEKRKDHLDDKQILDSDSAPSLKKRRVVWTNDLHEKFVNAVNRMGLDKVGPKKILDLMAVPNLTRENVASHLQKYRIHLCRVKKENELKAACGGGGMMLSNFSTSENTYLESGLVTPSSLTLQQNIVINENYVSPGHKLHIHNTSDGIREGNVAGILSMPMHAEAVYEDVVDAPTSNSSRIGILPMPMYGDVVDTPTNTISRIAYNQQQSRSESNVQAHYTWSGGRALSTQFTQQHIKPHFQFDHFPLVSHSHGSSRREADLVDHQPMDFYGKNRSYAFGHENTATIPPHYYTFEQSSHMYHNDCTTAEESLDGSNQEKLDTTYNVESSMRNMVLGMDHNDCTTAEESLDGSNQEKLDTMLDLHESQIFEDEYGSKWNDIEQNEILHISR